jgi:pyruvate dehydrogenase E1 component
MYGNNEDIFYYLTIYNENYAQPAKPPGVEQGILDGIYRFEPAPDGVPAQAAILFSGPTHAAAAAARDELAERWGVGAELWSVTSYKRLREEALAVERWNRLNPGEQPRVPMVTERLSNAPGPIVAVSDYMRSVPEQVARFVPGRFNVLGTDGYGRSDDRPALRAFFETDAPNVVVAVLQELAGQGVVDRQLVIDAVAQHSLAGGETPPWTR